MLIAGVSILVSFAVLIWSADLFVDGAASIAENMGLSPIIIGLTIVVTGDGKDKQKRTGEDQ